MRLFYPKKTISFESLFRITFSFFSIHSETVIFTPCGQVGTLNLFGTNSVIFVILAVNVVVVVVVYGVVITDLVVVVF